MRSELGRLPKPEPDVGRLKAVLRRERPDRVPLVELAIAEEVLEWINGRPLPPVSEGCGSAALREGVAARVALWHRLGYDYYRVRAEIPFAVDRLAAVGTGGEREGGRQWMNEGEGVIRCADDIERYGWPRPAEISFSHAEAAIAALPDGMEAIGFSGGVLEWASTLIGLEPFMMGLFDQPGFIQAVVDRVGEIVYSAFEVFCQMDGVFAIWLGDDMGFKTATLISPDDLRRYILPWHRRYAELAHRTGRFFLLHSCGHVEAIMPDLIEDVGIDAKHSFEDVITPVEEFKRRWGSRVAVLGGVDVDLLSRRTAEEIGRRTSEILESCAGNGGYACGSGNSVTNYVRPENYLAMVETVHRWNGRV